MESSATVGRHQGSGPNPSEAVRIDYVNYRGERGLRRIVPFQLYFGEVEWHPGEQWILDAWDLDKDAIRSFAIIDIWRWGV